MTSSKYCQRNWPKFVCSQIIHLIHCVSSKMADITIEQNVDLIEFYFTNQKSGATTIRGMKTKYGKDLNVCDATLYR